MCGESPLSERDLKLRGLFGQLFHAFSNIDGRLIRSLRYLVSRPGVLTEEYVKGCRMPYLGPIQVFLVANVLFFAMQSMTNTNIVSSPLDSHLHVQDWSPIAQSLVTQRLEAKQLSLDQYSPIFNQAVVLHGKSSIVLMVLPFTVLLLVMFYRNGRPFVTHVVFSLHFYAFLLLLFCVSLTVVEIDVLAGGDGLKSARMDNVLSLINLAVCTTYLYIATGIVYDRNRLVKGVQSLLLAIAVTGILLGYRFLLFLITLYTT